MRRGAALALEHVCLDMLYGGGVLRIEWYEEEREDPRMDGSVRQDGLWDNRWSAAERLCWVEE